MTPAIDLVKKKKIRHAVHEYKHDASTESYGIEAAEKLGVSVQCILKTIVVNLDQ